MSYQPQLGGLGPRQVHALRVAGAQLRLGPLHLGLHALAGRAQHLVHAGEHALGGPRERQVEGADGVRAQPRGGPLEPAARLVHGLPHAHDHERGEHVARAGEVGVQRGEADLEGAGPARGRHGRADDGEGPGGGLEVVVLVLFVVVVVVVEGDGGQDYVGDFEFAVDHFDGAGQGGHVCYFDVGEESGRDTHDGLSARYGRGPWEARRLKERGGGDGKDILGLKLVG